MAEYKLTNSDIHVVRTVDNAMIPNDSGNVDWIEYQAWLEAGGVPDSYDQSPPPPEVVAPRSKEE